jgi:hypothetical protein
MFASFSTAGWRECLAADGWVFVWINVVLAFCLLFLYDHRELSEKIKNATGKHKTRLWLRRLLLWSVPIAAFIAAVISQLGSDIADAKISSLGTDLQTAKTVATNAALKAAALEPDKQPILSMTANAHFTVKGQVKPTPWATNFVDVPHFGVADVMWGTREQIISNFATFGLTTSKFIRFEGPRFTDFSMEFQPDPYNPFWQVQPAPLAEVAHKLNAAKIHTRFLPEGSEIVSGRLTITVNSFIRKEFPIPPQRPSFFFPITYIVSNGCVYGPPVTSIVSNGVAYAMSPSEDGKPIVMPYPTNMAAYEFYGH